jgi:TonB family protein
MIKQTAVAVVAVALASAAFADDADIAKGLQNLTAVHRIANVIELRRTLGTTSPLQIPTDPWGTSYRVDETSTGYRIVSAGSDAKFDDVVVLRPVQFEGLEGDVVWEDGKLIRSNRNWLHARVAQSGASADALKQLQEAEIDVVTMRIPVMRAIIGAAATVNTMQRIGTYVEEKKTAPSAAAAHDGWGTPMRVIVDTDGSYRIISAGADRTFDESSWTRGAAPNFDEDFIYENGKLTRYVNEKDALRAADLTVAALPQPPDESLAGKGRWLKLEPAITAPVVKERVNPVYPEDYRRAHLGGLVVAEAAVAENGTVEKVGILKSVAPGFDAAVVAAVRQWKFQPAMRNGKAVPVLFNLTIDFKPK